VPVTVTNHFLAGYARFADATTFLADQAQTSCSVKALRPAFRIAFDAWMAGQYLQLGPIRDDERELATAFWPVPKASGVRAQLTLLTGTRPNSPPPPWSTGPSSRLVCWGWSGCSYRQPGGPPTPA